MFTFSNLLMGMLLVSLWLLAACVIRSCCKTMKVQQQPGMPGAMMLVLLAAGGSVAMQFMLGMMLGFSLPGFHVEPEAASQLRIGLTAPIWMLVGASVYRFMVPTTFGKAMTMFLAQAAVVAASLVGLSMLASITQYPALVQLRDMLPL